MPIDRFSSDDQMTTIIADADYDQTGQRLSFHAVSLPNSNDDTAPPVADVMPVRGPVLLAVLMRLAHRLRGQTAVSTRGIGPFGGLFWPLLAVGLSACAGKNNPAMQDGGPVTGYAVDGPLVGGKLFRDTDKDGIQDSDEPTIATTGSGGAFSAPAGTNLDELSVNVEGARDAVTDLIISGPLVLCTIKGGDVFSVMLTVMRMAADKVVDELHDNGQLEAAGGEAAVRTLAHQLMITRYFNGRSDITVDDLNEIGNYLRAAFLATDGSKSGVIAAKNFEITELAKGLHQENPDASQAAIDAALLRQALPPEPPPPSKTNPGSKVRPSWLRRPSHGSVKHQNRPAAGGVPSQ